MGCLPCFSHKKVHPREDRPNSNSIWRRNQASVQEDLPNARAAAREFSFRKLVTVINNFGPRWLLNEDGLATHEGVYKGRLADGQVVDVKDFGRNGHMRNKEFLIELLMLCLLNHPNIVNLMGYCTHGDRRLLVYEFVPYGSLEDHLHDLTKEPLNWNTRMRIAAGAAKALKYLHEAANPPILFRDFRPSNILLDEEYTPKLSSFGHAVIASGGSHTGRLMGTCGYWAPEYIMTGQFTVKSDVYSFGVVLLELITGRKPIGITRPMGEQNLVALAWLFYNDHRKFTELVDPRLQGKFPTRGLQQAVAVAAMCIDEEATARPLMSDVVTALSHLANQGV